MTASARSLTGTALAAVLALPSAGCASEAEVGAGAPSPAAGTTVLAKADGWRPALAPLAYRYHGVMEIAGDPASAARAWTENRPPAPGAGDPGAGQQALADVDDVDLSRQAVVVWSSGESSSCPDDVVRMTTTPSGRLDLTIGDAAGSGRVCTADYVGYRMVLAVDRDRLPTMDRLPTTDVHVDGTASAATLLVTTYPATGPGGAPRR